jgi:hypothetical protein
MTATIPEQLLRLLPAEIPLERVAQELRAMKAQGVQQSEVKHALESLRATGERESEEDRILEILDLVSGFCAPRLRIWESND